MGFFKSNSESIKETDTDKDADQVLDIIKSMQKEGNFEILPCENMMDFQNGSLQKLQLGSVQQTQIGNLIHHIPSLLSTTKMAQAYVVRFPEGLPHVLTPLSQGGLGGMIRGDQGHFVGTASFYPVQTQAILIGAFTAMSIASSQYFLTQINNQLTKINLNLDKILEFLYGDKRAELLAEVDFTQYVYENYNSIMTHEDQRVASIAGLQQAKKVAMKDMEFYMMDLDSLVRKRDNSDIFELLNKVILMKESIEVSIQLYVIGSLMEMYCSQNYDSNYIQYLENCITSYIEKYEKRLRGTLGKLCEFIEQQKGRVRDRNKQPIFEEKFKTLNKFIDSSEESVLRKTLQSVLRSTTQVKEFYITNDGNVYCKTQK